MGIIDILKLNFRKNVRSQAFYRGLAIKLLMGFMVLYFAVLFLMIGLFLGDILDEVNSELNPLQVFNGISIYIVFGALLIRFFMQQLNSLNLELFQLLPVKRKTLVHSILVRSIFSPVNYVTMLVVVPFAVRTVVPWFSGQTAVQLVINCVMLIWFNSWMAAFLKRRFGSSLIALLVVLVFVAGMVALEYFKIFSFFDVSVKVFGLMTIQPFGWLITFVVAAAAYMLNISFFNRNYYPEKFNEKITKNENNVTGGFSFLEKYGTIGELIRLQMLLIFRHKRTKSMLYLSAFFLLYGLFFYMNPVYDTVMWLAFIGLVVTGMASMMYGQYIMGWDSGYFDLILTKNIPLNSYIRANFLLLTTFNIISFVLSSPYFLFGMNIAYLQIAFFFFNTGINVFLLMFFASFNTKRIDLMARSSFNYQGTTYKSFLILLPIMLFPVLLAAGLGIFLSFNQVMLVIGLIGLLGIATMPYQIKICTKQLERRKYAMASGFREKE